MTTARPPARRSLVVVMDSVGIGAAPDAAAFGAADVAANTVLHTVAHAANTGRRLALDELVRWGLAAAVKAATGQDLPGWPATPPEGWAAALAEVSAAKDTLTGHWEMMGVSTPRPWHVFADTDPSIPPDWIEGWARACGVPGVLGNVRADGLAVLERWGAASRDSGRPIVYTSADSVIQIAVHASTFGLPRLAAIAAEARARANGWPVARIITRPFMEDGHGGWMRTVDRHDWVIDPPAPLLSEILAAAGIPVYGLGKIPDILGHRGLAREVPVADLEDNLAKTLEVWRASPAPAVVMTNLAEFDTLHGHRRDPEGYGAALETVSRWLTAVRVAMQPHDLVIVTADHGNDPTAPGHDHTREWVPWLMQSLDAHAERAVGLPRAHAVTRRGFDLTAQTLAAWHGIDLPPRSSSSPATDLESDA